MADTQDNALPGAVPAGSETPPAANEQTESAPVKDSSGAAEPQDTANEPASDTGADEGEGDSGEPKKPKSEIQKRIDRITRQKGRLERENAALAERLTRLEGRVEGTGEPKPQASDKPRLDQFPDYESFQESLTEWTVKQTLRKTGEERQQSERQRSQRELQAERTERFLESSEAAREKYDDFDEIVLGPKNKVTPVVAGLIADTDNPGEIAYYLATHPDESKRINSLPGTKAAIELGKLEVKISTPSPKRVSAAPAPARTPSGGNTAHQRPLESLSQEEFYTRRQAQLRGKG